MLLNLLILFPRRVFYLKAQSTYSSAISAAMKSRNDGSNKKTIWAPSARSQSQLRRSAVERLYCNHCHIHYAPSYACFHLVASVYESSNISQVYQIGLQAFPLQLRQFSCSYYADACILAIVVDELQYRKLAHS